MNTQSINVGTFTVRQIVPISVSNGGTGAVEFAPKFLGAMSIRPTIIAHAATVNPLPAADLVNSQIINTGAVGAITLTMPTAAAVLAAFSAAGTPLAAGDSFSVKVCSTVAQSIIFAPSASVTTASGAANFTVTASTSAVITFIVTSVVSSAEAINFSGLLSN